jgi:enterobacterial common antigen flippase
MASVTCSNQISTTLPESLPQTASVAPAEKGTYGQILKSSALVGGSSVLNIAIGIVRTKAMAVLLGPAGFGLLSLYGSIVTLTQTLAGMGINSSGVRQIAEAAGSDDTANIAQTTFVLRRTSILLGLLGAFLLVIFSRQVSTITFGTNQHAAAVSVLSLAVFFSLVSAGQGALIQGMRRIAEFAKMGVLGALSGTLISIPLVYFFRDRGVVPSLVAVAVMTALASWWYSSRICIQPPPMTVSHVMRETGGLLKLGFAFMSSGLMTMGVAYVIRITVLRKVGFEATGLYQSAWTLGGLYVGFILQAMGADFYPRLTASAKDNKTCNRLVNEQAQVGLLLAGPGVIATLTFAPLVIALFYSAKFGAAVGILRWICLGTVLQVVTWPMGFIIVAKARQALFIGCELAWTVVSLGLAWLCVSYFGLDGVGIAFFGSYIFHGFLIHAVVRRLSGFRWSEGNIRTGLLFLSIISLVFGGFYVLPFLAAVCVGTFAVIFSGIYSIRVLVTLVSFDQIPYPAQRLLKGFGFGPRPSVY